MNSTLKGILHTVASALGLWLAAFISGNPYISLPLAGVIMSTFNWLVSHYIPTTSGASARQ